MPHGSFPGKGKARNEASNDHRHGLLRTQIEPWTSALCRARHLIFPEDADQSIRQSETGSHDVPVSAIAADRASVGERIQIARFWNARTAHRRTTRAGNRMATNDPRAGRHHPTTGESP